MAFSWGLPGLGSDLYGLGSNMSTNGSDLSSCLSDVCFGSDHLGFRFDLYLLDPTFTAYGPICPPMGQEDKT